MAGPAKWSHRELLNEGIIVSLNSVRRTIDRWGLMKKRGSFKRFRPHVDRPIPEKAGDLVQIDTVHRMIDKKRRLYVFALIDVYSRWGYAKACKHIDGRTAIEFVDEAERAASFKFEMVQTDHGPEFSRWFVSQVKKNHRYTRIGKPNDNSHFPYLALEPEASPPDVVDGPLVMVMCSSSETDGGTDRPFSCLHTQMV